MNASKNTPLWLQRLPPHAVSTGSVVLSLLTGVAAAVVLHYVLYRIGLPSQPFIYVAF